MTGLFQDLRYGLRSLLKNPGFAAVPILTLALGVGANTAIFTVLRAVVLRDLPYHEPHRIAVMWTKNIRQNLPDGSSYLNFRDWKEQSREFQAMAAYIRPEFTRGTLAGASGAERIHVGQVGPGFFELLGATPVLGRTFESDDFTEKPHVVVIGYGLWRQRFGGDRTIIGRVIQFDDENVQVIGVIPPEFELPTADVQVWQPLPGAKGSWNTVVGVVADMRRQRLDEPAIPYMFQPGINRQMDVAVRTANDPDLSRDAIRAEMRALDPVVPPYGITTVEQRLGRTVALRRLQTMLLVALAAVALGLSMIGAYGVIHQSVAARTQEIGIRIALGANASAVLWMVLAGGMIPALAGLGVGLLGSLALSQTASTFLYETNSLDPTIYVGVTALLLLVTTAACLAPARRAARFDPVAALRGE